MLSMFIVMVHSMRLLSSSMHVLVVTFLFSLMESLQQIINMDIGNIEVAGYYPDGGEWHMPSLKKTLRSENFTDRNIISFRRFDSMFFLIFLGRHLCFLSSCYSTKKFLSIRECGGTAL